MAKKDIDLHEFIGKGFRHNWHWWTVAALSADGETVFLREGNGGNGKVKETLDAKTVKTILKEQPNK